MNVQPVEFGPTPRPNTQPVAIPGGRWLLLARVSWCVVAVLSLTFFVSGLPERISELTPFWITDDPVPPDVIRAGLRDLGLTPGIYVGIGLALIVARAAACYLIGALLFWRKSTERMALLVAIFLVAIPSGDVAPPTLHAMMKDDPARAVTGIVTVTVGFALVFWLFLVFPDGHFTPRWTRWAAMIWLIVGAGTIFLPGTPVDMLTWPTPLSLSFIPAFAALAIGIMIWRYQRVSGALERQQTKWFLLGFAFFLVEFAITTILIDSGAIDWSEASPRRVVLADLLLHTVHNLAILAVPLTLAVAMFRHRLWDFERLINRAMLYASLTAVLAVVYLGGVVTLERIFRAAIGHGSNLAIAATTLAVAALIQPLRRRLQTGIDRRFARRKYDAARTLAAFVDTLRDETDPHSIQAGLLQVVVDTMQPAHVSLWLRSEVPVTGQQR